MNAGNGVTRMSVNMGNDLDRNTCKRGPGRMGWVVAMPLLMAFCMGTSTLVMALRSADVPLPGAVWKQGPIQFGNATARERAATAGLAGTVRREGRHLLVDLHWQSPLTAGAGDWELLYWHTGDGRDDLRVRLQPQAGAVGELKLRAELEHLPAALRHEVLLRSPDGRYELVGHDAGDPSGQLELQP